MDGAVVVDLAHFNRFSMDNGTWHATVGAGSRLADIYKKLHDAGGRAIAHAVCPGVGIGGQATIVSQRARGPGFEILCDVAGSSDRHHREGSAPCLACGDLRWTMSLRSRW